MRILITGATGNVGREIIQAISSMDHQHEVFAGVRDLHKKENLLDPYPEIKPKEFDFDKTDQFVSYLEGIDVLFLLRPPHISNVKKYFQPLVEAAKTLGLHHVVFLSVQGVENSSFIPHHKIEKLIMGSGLYYTFLRPAYFMQNFSTTLKKDIVTKNQVYLPAGHAKFNLIDLKDVGEVAAHILTQTQNHRYKAYDLTNAEQMDFKSMCAVLSRGIGRKIDFVSPNLLSFFFQKRKEGMAIPFILVVIMLHYLPRFQKPLPISDRAEQLLDRLPATFAEFVDRESSIWDTPIQVD